MERFRKRFTRILGLRSRVPAFPSSADGGFIVCIDGSNVGNGKLRLSYLLRHLSATCPTYSKLEKELAFMSAVNHAQLSALAWWLSQRIHPQAVRNGTNVYAGRDNRMSG